MKPVLIWLIFTIIGCTTSHPVIEDGTYYYPKYEFSVPLPPKWTQLNGHPDWINKNVLHSKLPEHKSAFISPDGASVIGFAFDKSIPGISILEPDDVRDIMKKAMEEQSKLAEQSPETTAFHYETDVHHHHGASFHHHHGASSHHHHGTDIDLDADKVEACHPICHLTSLKTVRKDSTIYENVYIYECDGDDTCLVSIVLIKKAGDEQVGINEYGWIKTIFRTGTLPPKGKK